MSAVLCPQSHVSYRFSVASLILVVFASHSNPVKAADWTEFRGPGGRGVAVEGDFPTKWDRETAVEWRTALPRPANSSPIVSEGRVFLTYGDAAGKKRTLACFDRTDGHQMWQQTVAFDGKEETHKTNPYGGATPVTDGQRVIVWHGSPGLFCYSMKGELLWSRKIAHVGHIWGYGSSPVLDGDLLFLNHGPGAEQFLIALNKKDGSIVWRFDEPGGANTRDPRMVGSWSTPAVVEVDGEPQLICSMPSRVVALKPETGELLWSCGGLPSARGDLVYTSVIYSDSGIGVAMGGYQGPSIGFRLGGRGDVTEKNSIWRQDKKQPQRIGSGVIIGDSIYMANAGPGTFQCIELGTGRDRWNKRLSGDNWGSLVLAGEYLYVTNRDGLTRVLKPNREECEVIAENPLNEPSNATPAFSNGQIFLRTDNALYCIGTPSEGDK